MALCYIVLLDKTNGVNYDEAKDRCSKINGTVIMPKTKEEADWIASKVDFGIFSWVGLSDYDADYVYTWEDGTNAFLSTLYWHYTKTGLPTTSFDQTTNHADFEATTLRTETEIPAKFYNQTTNHANFQTTTLPTETTVTPATFYNQTTKHASLETITLPTETTEIPTTSYNQTTKHANLETTTLPAANMSLTLTLLECEELWMNQSSCNCQEPSAIPGIPNDIITYRLDKTTLSSYISKRSSASDPRKSSFYIGCVGIIVLVLSVLHSCS
ncbi:unnamed protein product [Mytilus edulis]|uniref:C-type lectin domain-containing protein n=1 Tax=Mytilus edulis TaxID=6550 RepID=A0A8S3V0C2_MYTED|nr:unnamed protein product [Mytilus edulis]